MSFINYDVWIISLAFLELLFGNFVDGCTLLCLVTVM